MFTSLRTHRLVSTLVAALAATGIMAAVALANIEPAATKASLVSTNTELTVPALGATLTCKDAVAFHSLAGGTLNWELGAPSFKECKAGAAVVNVTTKATWKLHQKAALNLTEAEIELPAEAATIEIVGVCTIKVEKQVIKIATWKNGTNSELNPSTLMLTKLAVALTPGAGCTTATTAEFSGVFVATDLSTTTSAIKFT